MLRNRLGYQLSQVLLLLAAITTSAQTPGSLSQTIAGASVANIEVNSGEKTAIVEVMNNSGKDITGFVLVIDAVYSSGRKHHSEYTTDYGPFQTQFSLC
jgi:hypothetical protein